ncbi:serine/threonine-protein phosphatase 6 regulatory ankyrin repeat subunit C [Aplysia californica]|uniref:Serine/threonine-protein phosphatase 6 regulatory ankyrin repeat subunit C n=1 Tax=Aplysia californica TaxID=6500 RepID=A0ABM0JVH7_APLCA|nr:serine/threonine-protein phosphatase 6 regulatory ankyrin repeat subunit C [Aplysia californica]
MENNQRGGEDGDPEASEPVPLDGSAAASSSSMSNAEDRDTDFGLDNLTVTSLDTLGTANLLTRLMIQNNLHRFDGTVEDEEEIVSVTSVALDGSSIVSYCNCDHAKSIWCSRNQGFMNVLARIYSERKGQLPAGSASVVASLIVAREYGESSVYTCPDCACSLRYYNVYNTRADMQEQLLDAIRHHDVRIVEDLLEKRQLNPNYELHKKNPICRAVGLGNIEIITLLLDAGAEVDTPNHADLMWDRKPVHIAACKGHLASIQLLISRGADINQVDSDQRTPLHWVAMYGHSHLIPWMMRTGSAVNVAQNDGFTPLHTATCLGHVEVCRELLKGGASLTQKDRDGWTPLHTAVCYGNTDVIRLLLSQPGCPVMAKTSTDESILHIACSKGRVDIIDLVLQRGLPLESRNKYGATPLHIAVYYNRIHATFYLIKCGANVNTTNNVGLRPAYLAAVRGEMQILQLLLSAGCFLPPGTCQPVTQHSPSLASEMQEKETRPQTLKDLCLLVVRATLAPHLQKNTRCLPVPIPVKRALAMHDLSFVVSNGNGGHMLVSMDPDQSGDNLNELVFRKLEDSSSESETK